MKRYIALLLLIVLLLPCMAVPASATTQGVIDAIDDLASGLGTSQRDILDAIEAECQNVVTAVLNTRDVIEAVIHDVFDDVLSTISSRVLYIANNLSSMKTTLETFYNTWYTIQQKYIMVMSRNIEKIRDNIATLLAGDSTKSDAFDEDLATRETEFDEMLDVMETSPTINIDDIDTEVDKVTSFETEANYISVLSSIFLNDAFLLMFTWCIILAMLGFILYGKR